MNLLELKDLSVTFNTPEGKVCAVNKISLSLTEGETFGIVGESGSGKSQLVLAMMGLLAKNSRVSGQIYFKGTELTSLTPRQLNTIRGNKIAMIFQDPMTCLNPYLRISTQMTEVLLQHKNISKKAAHQEAIHMLDAVKISDARNRINMYPHEFSGGMRQRVMIAMAILCQPELLIADEPTTALDVTVQAQTIELLAELQREFKMTTILITHDMGVIAGICEKVMVMYAGRVMEAGPVNDIFYRPNHPYTKGLLDSIPSMEGKGRSALQTIRGNPPSVLRLPTGCPFQERCDFAIAKCAATRPELVEFASGRFKACHRELLEAVS
jgi:oligopeptide transport system ATP-binding protein